MKKIHYIGTAFIAGLVILGGCAKKETTIKEEYNPSISAYGLWKITESADIPDLKYLFFRTTKVCDVYYENDLGFRAGLSSNYTPYPDQLLADILGGGTPNVYNYTTTGDSLFIYKGGNIYIKGVKAPETDVAAWSVSVSSSDLITGLYSGVYGGIGFDGTNVLLCEYSNGKVFKVNMTTRLPGGEVDVTGSYPNTVEFDGTDIWVGSNGYDIINRHSAAGGSILSTSKSMGAWIYGVAYDPATTNLWCYSGNEDSLYTYSKSTDAIITRQPLGDGFSDMAWSNGKLYLVKGNYIYRVKPSPLTVEKTYRYDKATSVSGIAAVNATDFWLSVDGDKLVKVTLN